jgi:2-polyprenyl-3-methyl-5-hydroxy-6-metoxy-1,4-benzoquinol methylase
MSQAEKFRGYDVVDTWPEDAWLKGYFYVNTSDIKNSAIRQEKMYKDLGYIKHKDHLLHLLDIKNGDKVLDVGCQVGAVMVYCGLLGAEVHGVDLSEESVGKANANLRKYAIKGSAVTGDARKLDFADGSFDKAVSSDFFEHLSFNDNVEVFKEVIRVLKPGGIFIVKTPNLAYLRISRLFKMAARALKLKNPFDVVIAHTTGKDAQHIGLATKRKMVNVIKAAGVLNFRLCYDTNSRIERFSPSLAEFLAQMPFLRSCVTEELIAIIYKPIIPSLFR